MQANWHSIRNTGKRLGGGLMGSLMLLSGAVMPYQGLLQKPLTGLAAETELPAETAADSAVTLQAETTAPVTTAKPVTTTDLNSPQLIWKKTTAKSPMWIL